MPSGSVNGGSGKKSGAKSAKAISAAAKKSGGGRGLPKQRQIPWMVIGGVVAVVALIAVIAVSIVPKYQDQQKLAAWTPSESNQDPSTALEGIVTVDYPAGQHIDSTQRVAYDRTPPFGGPHDSIWATCTGVVYPEAIRNRFEGMLQAARAAYFLQEEHNFYIDQQMLALTRLYFLRLGERLVTDGALVEAGDIFMLSIDEVKAAVRGDRDSARRIVPKRMLDLIDAAKEPPQWDGDVVRRNLTGCDLRQHRGVEQVVVAADQYRLDAAVRGHPLLQSLGDVERGIAAAEDDDPLGPEAVQLVQRRRRTPPGSVRRTGEPVRAATATPASASG